jgi:hypothetical protein
MAELLTGFNGKRIFAERASQDSAGDCIRTTYLKKAELVTTQSDWEEENPSNIAYIKHKPNLALKADKQYVDEKLALKADKTEVSHKLEKVFVSNGASEQPTELVFDSSNKSVTIPLAEPGPDENTWGNSGLVKGTMKTFQ